MNKLKNYIWALSVALTLFSCRQNESKEQFFSTKGSYKFDGKTINILNKQSEAVSLSFDLNERFPIAVEVLIDSIYALTKKMDIDTAQAAWYYVVQNSFHTTPFSQNQWLHQEFIFTNSAASGYCDDLSTYLVKIWKKLGYEARVIRLEGHVVAEVFHQGKWKLYDPDLRMFFLNKKNEIASLSEIEADSSLLENTSELFPNIFSLDNALKKRYTPIFLSKENNISDNEWFLKEIEQIDPYFTLPSNTVFTIHYDSFYTVNTALIKLNSKSKGMLNIPLVPFCIEGEVECKLGNHSFILNNTNFTQFIDDYAKIEVVQVKEPTKIYYTINPYVEMFNLEQENICSYQATDEIELNTSAITSSPCLDSLNFWQMDRKLDQLMEQDLVLYFEAIKNKSIKESDFKSDFQLFSSYYPNMKSYADLVAFKVEISKDLNISEQELNQIIVDLYPTSTFMLYSSLIEDNKPYLLAKVKTIIKK